jgi:hypothetical protein
MGIVIEIKTPHDKPCSDKFKDKRKTGIAEADDAHRCGRLSMLSSSFFSVSASLAIHPHQQKVR